MREVVAAYRDARSEATGASTFRLRWQVRRWNRCRDQLDQAGLARLAAIRDELRARGEDVPTT